MNFLPLLTGLVMSVSPPDTDFTIYETEITEETRKVYSFTLPEVKPVEGPVNHSETPMRINYSAVGNAQIDAPALVRVLLARHLEINALTEELEGFRVQVYAGNSMEAANAARGEVIKSFPDDHVYQLWSAPHFRVRVGDYLSRSDAMRELNRLKIKFPGAYIVPDKVKTPKYKHLTVQPPRDYMPDGTGPGEE